jgi:hypothetical protein
MTTPVRPLEELLPPIGQRAPVALRGRVFSSGWDIFWAFVGDAPSPWRHGLKWLLHQKYGNPRDNPGFPWTDVELSLVF